MKQKIILLSLLLTTFCSLLPAQENKMNELIIGTTQGVTLSSASFYPKVKQSLYPGYNGGFFLRYISEKYFAFQLELNYSQNGWKELMEETPEYEYSRRFHYIEIPFMTHMYFGKKNKGFINIGPKIGYLLSESETINFDPSTVTKLKVKEQYQQKIKNKFDYGIVAGVGFQRDTSIGHFALEGRFYFGLADFFKTGAKDFFGTASQQVISINLSYGISVIH